MDRRLAEEREVRSSRRSTTLRGIAWVERASRMAYNRGLGCADERRGEVAFLPEYPIAVLERPDDVKHEADSGDLDRCCDHMCM
jgi:hypothetical protein